MYIFLFTGDSPDCRTETIFHALLQEMPLSLETTLKGSMGIKGKGEKMKGKIGDWGQKRQHHIFKPEYYVQMISTCEILPCQVIAFNLTLWKGMK